MQSVNNDIRIGIIFRRISSRNSACVAEGFIFTDILLIFHEKLLVRSFQLIVFSLYEFFCRHCTVIATRMNYSLWIISFIIYSTVELTPMCARVRNNFCKGKCQLFLRWINVTYILFMFHLQFAYQKCKPLCQYFKPF
jgi:hypothetical protein